jgi:hypothetical protein
VRVGTWAARVSWRSAEHCYIKTVDISPICFGMNCVHDTLQLTSLICGPTEKCWVEKGQLMSTSSGHFKSAINMKFTQGTVPTLSVNSDHKGQYNIQLILCHKHSARINCWLM